MIIVNPVAHTVPSRKRRAEIDEWLRGEGWSVDWQETQHQGHATEIAARAAEKGVPLVMSAGGDGTLNEAANGLAGTDTALGMIPGGLSNLWAREFGLGRKPLEAVQLMVNGEVHAVDLGCADGRYFLQFCGFGVDAAITRHVSTGILNKAGAAGYALAAIREGLLWQGKEITVRLDGVEERMNVLMALVGNTRLYARITKITPTAVADDGLLDVCIYRGKGKRDIALHVMRTLLQRHHKSARVRYKQVRRLEFDWGDTPLPAQVDGDPLPYCPSEVIVVPQALRVAVPAGIVTPLLSRPAISPQPAELSLPRPGKG